MLYKILLIIIVPLSQKMAYNINDIKNLFPCLIDLSEEFNVED